MLSPTEDDIYRTVRAFLISVLPANTDVILAQVNRVPEPINTDYVLMTPLRKLRISTNTDAYNDCLFHGSIAGQVLTVTSINYGTISVGNTIFGVGVADGTTVLRANGTNSWLLSNLQTVAIEAMAAGTGSFLQPTEVVLQFDVHGPSSGDNAQAISTLWRDDYAVSAFLSFGPAAGKITPLYADDPRQMPFINDQAQYEDRWMIEAHLQADIAVVVPQQFADQLTPTLYEVDAAYPA